MIARHIIVRGQVQGVFYRTWTMETAQGLGVTGWVRNRGDGTVELLAMGDAEPVDALIQRLREGPPAARVDAVEVEEATAEPLDRFEKRPTI